MRRAVCDRKPAQAKARISPSRTYPKCPAVNSGLRPGRIPPGTPDKDLASLVHNFTPTICSIPGTMCVRRYRSGPRSARVQEGPSGGRTSVLGISHSGLALEVATALGGLPRQPIRYRAKCRYRLTPRYPTAVRLDPCGAVGLYLTCAPSSQESSRVPK